MNATRETLIRISEAGIANQVALARIQTFLTDPGTCSVEDAQLAIQYCIAYIQTWGFMPSAIEAYLRKVASVITV